MTAVHKSTFVVFAAVIMLFVALAAAVARSTSAMMTEEASRTVKGEVKEATLKVDRRLLAVETVTRNFAWLVREHLDDPDYMCRITQELVRNNDNIVGSAIAFEPNFYKAKGRLYAPYSCVSTNGQLTTSLLPYDYSSQDWYRVAKSSGRAQWCEPYFDRGGAEIQVCTYSVPLTNETGGTYAVLTADLSLKRLAERVSSICPYPHSYAVVISGEGQYLVLPPQGQTFERNEKTITIREKTANGWTLALVCPMEEILRGARKLTTVIVMFAGIGLLIIILISWALTSRVRRESALRERTANELEIARQIQASIVPKGIPSGVCAVVRPSRMVGGDICDFASRGDKVFFLVGDVAGSGIPAALFSFVAGRAFQTACKADVGPVEILGRINEALVLDNEQSLFMTAMVGVFDRRTGELRYGSAGRIPLVLVPSDGAARFLDVACQQPLGVSSGTAYESQTVQIQKGSKVLVFTDGVLNAKDADQVEFGKKRVLTFAAACTAASAAATANGLLAAVDDFAAAFEQQDDMAVLALER